MPRVHDKGIEDSDPIPAPGPWEVAKFGSDKSWEAYILQRRRERRGVMLRKQSKRAVNLTQIGLNGEHTFVEWAAIYDSMEAAISLRAIEMSHMKAVTAMIRQQTDVAMADGLTSFILNADIIPRENQKEVKSLRKNIITDKMRSRAEVGFRFFDQLMRMGPRPGTIKQDISRR